MNFKGKVDYHAPSPFQVAVQDLKAGEYLDVSVEESIGDGVRMMSKITQWKKAQKLPKNLNYSRKKISKKLVRIFAF